MKKNKKTVLICGIRDFANRYESQYFIVNNKGDIRFGDGLILGEGEAKFILSQVDVDEIIAIGSSNQCLEIKGGENKSTSGEKMKLNEGIEPFATEPGNLSDFDFFRYRLTQFVEGVNIDTADLIDLVESQRRMELMNDLKNIFGEDLSAALFTLVKEECIRNRVWALLKGLPMEEINWIRRYLYSVLDRQYRFLAKGHNSDIPISFVPITDHRDHKVLNRFNNLIAQLLSEKNQEIELYIDLHGFSLEDSFVCMNALYALNEDPNININIKNVTDENVTLSGYFYELGLSSERYRVLKLIAGMNSFLQNGKTDILREYWTEYKMRDPNRSNAYIDRMFLAMSYVDAGVSLCSIQELEKGICGLRALFHDSETQMNVEDEEEAIIMTLKDGIWKDYGPLVEDTGTEIDSLELIRWAYGKKFYQQVITIIESRIPGEMVRRGIFYPAESVQDKQAYLKAINYHYWDSLPKDRYIFRDLEHYFIKVYGRFAVNYRDRKTDKTTEYTARRVEQVFGNPEVSGLLPAHSRIRDQEQLRDILDKYYRLGNMRNTINHAISHQEPGAEVLTGESKLWTEVGNLIGDFIVSYEKVLESIGEQEFHQTDISQAEFMDYVFQHGPKSDPHFCKVPGYQSYRVSKGNRKYAPVPHKEHKKYEKNRNESFKETNPNIHIVLNVSRKKGLLEYIKGWFGKKAEDVYIEKQVDAASSQGNIDIRVNIE